MRIALIVPGFSADEADWCIPAQRNLAQALAESCDVHVFALRYPDREGTYRISGVTVHALGGGGISGLGTVSLALRCVTAVTAEHRRQRFDVIHAMWAHEAGFVATLTGRRLRVPVVVSLIGGELVGLAEIGYGVQLSTAGRWMVAFSLRQATVVAAGSQVLQQMALRHLGGRARPRIVVLPLGVDHRLFQPRQDKNDQTRLPGRPRLLQVGSLVPVKNHRTSIAAIRRLKQLYPDLHLHVVGSGPLLSELEAFTEAVGVKSAVTFHGAVPHHQLPAYYRAADLCLLPSRHEGLGLVILEAAGCGTPTVGAPVGLMPELEPAVRAVPVAEPDAFADAVAALLQDPNLLKKMGHLARKKVEQRYNLNQTTQAFLELYHQLACQ